MKNFVIKKSHRRLDSLFFLPKMYLLIDPLNMCPGAASDLPNMIKIFIKIKKNSLLICQSIKRAVYEKSKHCMEIYCYIKFVMLPLNKKQVKGTDHLNPL